MTPSKPCSTCQDYHFLCGGKVPCDNSDHLTHDTNHRYPGGSKHDWKPCPSCQEPSGKPRKNYAEAMAILKSMDPTKPGRCGRCQKCDSGGSCGRGGEGSSGVSLLSPSALTPTEDICASCNGPMVEDRRGGYLGGYMCLSEKCPAGQPPTPGEDWEGEFDKMMGKGDNEPQGHHTGCRYRTGYNEELKAFFRNLLSSRESKAREEGRKEGAEAVVKAVEEAARKHDEDRTHTGDCYCAMFQIAACSALTQTNPKKEWRYERTP